MEGISVEPNNKQKAGICASSCVITMSASHVRAVARSFLWRRPNTQKMINQKELRPKWLDPPVEPGEWLVGLPVRVRILDSSSNMWFIGVVLRAQGVGEGGKQNRWLVCFADGPRTELLMPGKWKCQIDDYHRLRLRAGTASIVNVREGGGTGQGAAGGKLAEVSWF